MKKNLIVLLFIIALGFNLAACQNAPDKTSTEATAQPKIVLTVAASPRPHAEILNQCIEPLAKENIELQVKEFTDWVLPDTVVFEGDADANYFQHVPYMENYNQENKADLVSVGPVHYEPCGLYGGKLKTLEELTDKASIAIPNDSSNQARALLLLQDLGWITLPDEDPLKVSILDIKENPHHLAFKELAGEQIPRSLQDVDYAVIAGNYALEAGLKVEEDALIYEKADAEAAKTYANILTVKKGSEDNPAIRKLYEVLTSDAIKEFMEKEYQGSVLPAGK